MSDALNNPILPVAPADRLPAQNDQAERRVVEAVRFLNRTEFSNHGDSQGQSLDFSYDEKAQKMVVKVLDRAGTELYQIPSPEIVRMAIEARRKAAEACGPDSCGPDSCCG
jgi:uncharacterized FlaG/YvyC family protein